MAKAKKHPCEGCKYLWNRSDGLWAMCNYWEDTGRLRPCKGGKDCTVREKGEVKRRGQFRIYPAEKTGGED